MNVRAAGNMMDAPQEKNWAGRVEDDALLRGLGRFGDDVRPSRAVHAVFVRSPHACAAIRGIDSAAAMQVPGVHAVITAADLAACGFGSVSNPVPMPGRLMTTSDPPAASARSRSPRMPVPSAGSAPPLPSSVISMRSASVLGRSASSSHSCTVDRAGRTAIVAAGERQCRIRLVGPARGGRRQAARHRRHLCGRAPCRAAEPRQPAARCRLARAARRDGEPRSRHRCAHVTGRDPGGRLDPQSGRAKHAAQAGRIAGRHRRCWRRLRHEGVDLPGISGPALCGAPPRAPGALGIDPLGGVSERQSGPRLIVDSRARA